jgi:predicted RNA-binding Zn-ribbon protein involved in translation (DUF1610 family)
MSGDTAFCTACREEVEHPNPDEITSLLDCPKCGSEALGNFSPHTCEECGEYAKRAFRKTPAKEQDYYVSLRGDPSGIYCSVECATAAMEDDA